MLQRIIFEVSHFISFLTGNQIYEYTSYTVHENQTCAHALYSVQVTTLLTESGAAHMKTKHVRMRCTTSLKGLCHEKRPHRENIICCFTLYKRLIIFSCTLYSRDPTSSKCEGVNYCKQSGRKIRAFVEVTHIVSQILFRIE